MDQSSNLLRQDLANRIAYIKKQMADGATGPLRVAERVVALSDEWESQWRGALESDEDFRTWLRRQLGRGRDLAWFVVRRDAVRSIGRLATCFHHEAAVWLHQRGLDAASLDKVAKAAYAFAKNQGDNPLSKTQALRVYAEVLGSAPRQARATRPCGECAGRDALVEMLQETLVRQEAEISGLRAELAGLRVALSEHSAAPVGAGT